MQKRRTMKQRLYIETSVVSYLAARPSRDLLIAARQEATVELWSMLLSSGFDGHVSTLVHQEIQRGDPEQARRRIEALSSLPVLDVDQEAQALAEQILAAKAVPVEYPDDALAHGSGRCQWDGPSLHVEVRSPEQSHCSSEDAPNRRRQRIPVP